MGLFDLAGSLPDYNMKTHSLATTDRQGSIQKAESSVVFQTASASRHSPQRSLQG